MPELWLNFTDPEGVSRRVRVEGSKFVMGRQSTCDLAIPDSRLSRSHAQIEQFAGRWEIIDTGSSNGTEVNGSPVFEPTPIYDGSMISLGGLQVRAEITEPRTEVVKQVAASVSDAPKPKPAPVTPSASGGRSVSIGIILAIPVLALVLVSLAGGVAYLVLARNPTVEVATDNEKDGPIADDDEPPTNDTPPEKTPVPTTSNAGPSNLPAATPANLSETAKVEVNGASFLRKIAQNDPKIFLTTDQAKRLSSKIKQISSSSAIAENLKSAKQNGAQLKTLAVENNLQPQFLAVAAVTKLGNSRGDVVATARTMAPIFNKLNIQIGSELADDCLLMIAAYEQGAAGETMKMRNMLQNLANEVSESSRTIRTIWFLEKRQKITAAEFDRALTFLAIGTLGQNPKDFGVNIDQLDL
ncbi:MAG: FHA domain-containing protein [bacterium]|nr:FHA domain-containing protein [bacterium]